MSPRSKKSKLLRLLAAQGGRCYYCDSALCRGAQHPKAQPTLDHRVPPGRGGSNAIENLVAACFDCNQRKGDMTGDEFLAMLDDSYESSFI